MKHILYIIGIAIIFWGCKKESTIGVEQSEYFIKFFGNSYLDNGYDVQQTADEGYIIIGSISVSATNKDIAIIKTNKFGNQEWLTSFGDSLIDNGRGVACNSNGDYIVVGSYSNSLGNSDVVVLKLNASGSIIWNKKIGGTASEEAYSIQETTDGGYIITGSTNALNTGNGNPFGEKDIFLLKINASGDSLWSKALGGSLSDIGYCVKQKNDKGFIIVGKTNSFSEPGQSSDNMIIIETNNFGIQTDKITYGGTGFDIGKDIQILSNGYAFVGSTINSNNGKSDVYFVKTTTDIHSVIMNKTYGGDLDDYGESIIINNDGSFIIVGSTESYGNGGEDSYLLKLTSDGTEDFHKTFGGAGSESANAIIQTTDMGYAFVGTTDFSENGMILLTKINNNCELN